MQFEIYQWLVPLMCFFFIVRTVLQYRKRKRSLQGTFIWVIFWSILIILAIIPNEASYKVAQVLGFKSNINAIIFVALGLLFLFVFYLSSTVDRLETQITELVRKLALDDQKRGNRNSKKKKANRQHRIKKLQD